MYYDVIQDNMFRGPEELFFQQCFPGEFQGISLFSFSPFFFFFLFVEVGRNKNKSDFPKTRAEGTTILKKTIIIILRDKNEISLFPSSDTELILPQLLQELVHTLR